VKDSQISALEDVPSTRSPSLSMSVDVAAAVVSEVLGRGNRTKYAYVANHPVLGFDPTGRTINYVAPGTGPLMSMGTAVSLAQRVDSLAANSWTGALLVMAVEMADTRFNLQDSDLSGGRSEGPMKYGVIGYPQDANRDGCLPGVNIDITVDRGGSASWYTRVGKSSGEIHSMVEVSPQFAVYGDDRVVIAHELTHALQYISAVEKGNPFIWPNPDFLLLRLGLNPEAAYFGQMSPPPSFDSVTTDQHNGFKLFDSDVIIYNELRAQ
jgi:hypothetical protein